LLDSIPQKKELVMALRKRLVFILLALLAIMAAAPVTVCPAAGDILCQPGTGSEGVGGMMDIQALADLTRQHGCDDVAWVASAP
jgi:hypothetical protein